MDTVVVDVDLAHAKALAAHLSDDELETLRALHDTQQLRPMDLGGRDGSAHSRWLSKLVNLGLALRFDRGGLAQARPSYTYRRTALGYVVATLPTKAAASPAETKEPT